MYIISNSQNGVIKSRGILSRLDAEKTRNFYNLNRKINLSSSA